MTESSSLTRLGRRRARRCPSRRGGCGRAVARLSTSSAPAVSPSDSSRSASRRPASSAKRLPCSIRVVEALLEQHAAALAVAGGEEDVRRA